MGARHRDCDGGLDPRKGGWLQRPSLLRGGSCMAQRYRSVPSFGSGKVNDERGGFLTPTAAHFDA